MSEDYRIGEGPATPISASLPEGTVEALRRRIAANELSSFIAAAVERELRGQVMDEYLADYERRKGPIPEYQWEQAREFFDRMTW
ncbi:hypothetical protein CDO52_15200 [Nocardiopsis gilva YIM 90087]|uniref:CopG family transcriptional regulator n=1 Tax=Nocardiopsis gilva YIM 90087 TaxID=1235441 RepID=A0A223S786_9ACTN|nr:hypothetical protein [Nocardiopsis gilva]ASU83949.1 hypothetical protein CDO52_15200 [Nocardiopsis gilva YIM 90087]